MWLYCSARHKTRLEEKESAHAQNNSGAQRKRSERKEESQELIGDDFLHLG